MASGGEYRRQQSSPKSPVNDEDVTSLRTREKLNIVREEIDRLKYESCPRETDTSTRTREQFADAEQELARLKMEKKKKTSTATQDELDEIEAKLVQEEEESSTIVSSSPSKPSSGREKVNESKEKLNFVLTRTEAEIGKLFESLKYFHTVDLCFLIDCTSSMQPYIDEVRNKIQDLVAMCKATFVDLVVNVAFVGYRDHCDGDDRIVVSDFTTDISFFKTFVGRVKASGGGDVPEDVFGGLEEVGVLAWSSPTRIVFHVADAPCHGTRFHEAIWIDAFPNGDPRGRKAEELLRKLEQYNVKYWFAKLNDSTDKMIQVFRSLLKDPKMLQQLTLDSAEELVLAVANSVSCTIREVESVTIADATIEAYSVDNKTSIERSNPREIRRTKSRSLKEFKLCNVLPNWNEIVEEDAYVFRNKLPATINELRTPLKEEDRKPRRIQIATQPFDEGTQRIVYYGVDCTHTPSKKVVLKEFKYLGDGLNKLDTYKKQMEIQSISFFLAQQFNKQKPPRAKDILFTKVAVLSLRNRAKPFYCSQEPLIEGPYDKYNSNSGYVNNDEYAASLNAFSHWTYQVTKHYLMVVDLQGVQTTSRSGEPKFALTDPALHCKDVTRFMGTNLGNDGMHRFFRSHHCNSICNAMRLEPNDQQPTNSSTIVDRTVVTQTTS